MRNLVICALAVAGLGAFSTRESSHEMDAAGRAKFIAASVDAIAPKDLGNGVEMSGARADGETVTLTFDGFDADEVSMPDFDSQAKKFACSNADLRNTLNKGVDLVFAFKSSTGASHNVRVASC